MEELKFKTGSETLGLHGRGNQFDIDLGSLELSKTMGEDSLGVEIIRGLMFFYVGQKGITLGKLREFFTEKSIIAFEHDGFIKIV